MNTAVPMLSLRGVGKSFDGHRVLAGVDLDVARGEVVSLIGPSGSGKTTLLRCMNFLETYDEGEVRVRGALLGYQRDAAGRLRPESDRVIAEVRAPLAMVFQQFNLWPHMTALANVMAPLTLAKGMRADRARQIAGDALARVGLSAKAGALPANLSGGQQQRVGIARALANDPDVLLSDEATSALDPETTHNILALLRDINRKTGVTVVMITHQMEVVREICDRVAVLSHGQVVEIGRTQDVFASPKHEVTRAMVSAATASDLTEGTLAVVRERIAAEAAARPGSAVRLWRLSLTGKNAGGALISDLAREHALDISLIQARVDDIQGVAVGTLFVLAQGAPQAVQGALAALADHDITIEEIAHEPATDRSAYHVAA